MTQTEKIELKTCPFCGEYPHIKKFVKNGLEALRIFCDECGVSPMVQAPRATAMRYWNTRYNFDEKQIIASEKAMQEIHEEGCWGHD